VGSARICEASVRSEDEDKAIITAALANGFAVAPWVSFGSRTSTRPARRRRAAAGTAAGDDARARRAHRVPAAGANCPADAPYRVGPKSLTCLDGIRVPGEQIFPSDLTDGEEQMRLLVAKGLVVAHGEVPRAT
jgi:hypothetical protein